MSGMKREHVGLLGLDESESNADAESDSSFVEPTEPPPKTAKYRATNSESEGQGTMPMGAKAEPVASRTRKMQELKELSSDENPCPVVDRVMYSPSGSEDLIKRAQRSLRQNKSFAASNISETMADVGFGPREVYFDRNTSYLDQSLGEDEVFDWLLENVLSPNDEIKSSAQANEAIEKQLAEWNEKHDVDEQMTIADYKGVWGDIDGDPDEDYKGFYTKMLSAVEDAFVKGSSLSDAELKTIKLLRTVASQYLEDDVGNVSKHRSVVDLLVDLLDRIALRVRWDIQTNGVAKLGVDMMKVYPGDPDVKTKGHSTKGKDTQANEATTSTTGSTQKGFLEDPYLKKSLLGQHYIELLLAIIGPTFRKKQSESKVFGLFIVDNKVLLTSLDFNKILKRSGWHYNFDFSMRKKLGMATHYVVAPAYLNIYCHAHRNGLLRFLLFLLVIQYDCEVEKAKPVASLKKSK